MRRWIREVFPSPGLLIGALVAYLLLCRIPELTYYASGGTGRYTPPQQFGLVVLGIVTVIYSLYRVVAFHPVYDASYLFWLRQTPWQQGKPLPNGPVYLVAQDAVLVAILTGLACLHYAASAYVIPVSFVAARIAMWFFTFPMTNQLKHAYLGILVFSGVIPLWNSPIGLLIVLGVLYAIVLHGIGETLRSFDEWSGRNQQVSALSVNSKQKNEKLLGWPYDRLAPRLNVNRGTFRDSLAISILITWWSFLAVACLWPHESQTLVVACLASTLGAAIRVVIYLAGYSAPLSLRGRVLTGQWIIPGFDIVWLAPALMLSLPAAVFFSCLIWNLPFAVGVPTIVFGSLMIGLECPPDLDEWKLTGNHHIVRGVTLNSSG